MPVRDVSLMANALNTHAFKAGLIEKAKLLSLAAGQRSIAVRGEQIVNVKSFTYLGCELAEGGGTIEDIINRICKDRGVFGIWRNSTVRRNTKSLPIQSQCALCFALGKWLTRTHTL